MQLYIPPHKRLGYTPGPVKKSPTFSISKSTSIADPLPIASQISKSQRLGVFRNAQYTFNADFCNQFSTLLEDEHILQPSCGISATHRFISDAYFIKLDDNNKLRRECLGNIILFCFSEKVTETTFLTLSHREANTLNRKNINDKEFSSDKPVLIMPKVNGINLSEIHNIKYLMNKNFLLFLAEEIGRIAVKDLILGIGDRIITESNAGNFMLTLRPIDENDGAIYGTNSRLLLIDNVINYGVTKKIFESYLKNQKSLIKKILNDFLSLMRIINLIKSDDNDECESKKMFVTLTAADENIYLYELIPYICKGIFTAVKEVECSIFKIRTLFENSDNFLKPKNSHNILTDILYRINKLKNTFKKELQTEKNRQYSYIISRNRLQMPIQKTHDLLYNISKSISSLPLNTYQMISIEQESLIKLLDVLNLYIEGSKKTVTLYGKNSYQNVYILNCENGITKINFNGISFNIKTEIFQKNSLQSQPQLF